MTPRALCPRHIDSIDMGRRLYYAFTKPVECAVCGLRMSPRKPGHAVPDAIAFTGSLPDEADQVCGGIFYDLFRNLFRRRT
jgi:hypothetical protein